MGDVLTFGSFSRALDGSTQAFQKVRDEGASLKNVSNAGWEVGSGAVMTSGSAFSLGVGAGEVKLFLLESFGLKTFEKNLQRESEVGSKAVTSGKNTNGSWSSRNNLSSEKNASQHWQKHGGEFPQYSSQQEYTEGARKFFSNPPKGTLTRTRSNGDLLQYHPDTNTFGVRNVDGMTKTMFRPQKGIEYWLNNK